MSETKPCPICEKPSVPDYHPFCSKRCADINLNRWFGEGYKVPVVELDDDIWDESTELPTDDPGAG